MSKKEKSKTDHIIKSGVYEKNTVKLDEIIRSIKENHNIGDAGALFSFSGIVRNSSLNGKEVTRMEIDAYEKMANKSIARICKEMKQREGIIDVRVIHFKGTFTLSEELVHVVVASAHRQEGLKTLSDTIEKYKKDIEVWKKEVFKDGTSKWIH
ncbi:MAG: molybdenum cofactor biosynthesis protein MoaE [Promethearchaeia archaeon]